MKAILRHIALEYTLLSQLTPSVLRNSLPCSIPSLVSSQPWKIDHGSREVTRWYKSIIQGQCSGTCTRAADAGDTAHASETELSLPMWGSVSLSSKVLAKSEHSNRRLL